MRVIDKYILRNFMQTFLMAFVVLTFLLMLGFLFKATTLIAQGASARIVLQYLYGGMPATFTFTVPISILASMMLVFGRLNGDSEIIAMKSSGLSLLSIMRVPIAISLLLTIFCVYANGWLAPESKYGRRDIRRQAGVGDILSLLEPRKFVEMPNGTEMYVGERNGNVLTDVRVAEPLESGSVRNTYAQRAVVVAGEHGGLVFELYNVTVNPVEEGKIGAARASKLVWNPTMFGGSSDKPYVRRIKDKNSRELYHEVQKEIGTDAADPVQVSRKLTELSTRLALAIACIVFCLISAPFATLHHKRESAIGVVSSLTTAVAYYAVLIAVGSLGRHPALYPWILACVPVAASLALAAVLLARSR